MTKERPSSETKPTTSRRIDQLIKSREDIGQQLITASAEGNTIEWYRLFLKAGRIDTQIKALTQSIPSSGATGVIGDWTRRSALPSDVRIITEPNKLRG